VMEILRQIARSLQEAHAAGLVHRDLKPGNVLVSTEPDGRRLVKVIDFGIARVEGSDHTGTGAVLGTPTYMAPEQCKGGAAGVDQRADVYALGVVLFQLLAGHPPFVADHPMAVMVMHVQAPPPPLPGGDESAALSRVLARALAKKPSDRFESVEALRVAFEGAASGALGALAGDDTLVHGAFDDLGTGSPLTQTEPVGRPPRVPRWLVVAFGLAAAAGGGVLATVLSSGSSSELPGGAVVVGDGVPVARDAAPVVRDAVAVARDAVLVAPDAALSPADAAPSAKAVQARVLRAELDGARGCAVSKALLTSLEGTGELSAAESRRLSRVVRSRCASRRVKPKVPAVVPAGKPAVGKPAVVAPVPVVKPEVVPPAAPVGKPNREL
jgi:hypothetical protein